MSFRTFRAGGGRRLPAQLCLTAAFAAIALGASAAEVSIGDGGSVRIVDGERSFQLYGRGRLATIFYDEDVTDLPTGLEMDQVLLGLRADLGNGWMVNVAYEFVDGALFDTSVTRTGLPIGDLQVGQFRPQIGLFDGGAWIIFNQRSMVEQALTIPRTLGVGVEGQAGRVSYALAVNGDQIDADTPGDDPLKYSGRLVVRPAPADWGVFHVGLNAIRQETPETRIHRFRADPIATFEDTPRLLEAVQTDARYRDVVGGEALWARGALSFQSEYMRAEVDSPGTPDMHGYYVQGAYIIGARRAYNERSATVGRPVLFDPKAGGWEFAVRYDTLDLSSAGGGSADNVGVAIVRYFSNPLRLGTSITRSSIDNGLNGDETITSVHLRLQWFL